MDERGYDASTETLGPITIEHGRVTYDGMDLAVIDLELHINSAGFASAVFRVHDRGGVAVLSGTLEHCIRAAVKLRDRS